MEAFYNKKAASSNSFEQRNASAILPVRQYNNWIKACLISEHTKRRDHVLDLCGGKGGDLEKWRASAIASLTLLDLSGPSVEEACRRYNAKKYPFGATFLVGDCRQLSKSPLSRFHIISCQFALHYVFDTLEHARKAIQDIATYLVEGGRFLVTLPSAQRIKAAAGNEFYKVVFETDNRYIFWLQDAIGSVAEYLVDPQHLMDIAKSAGLTTLIAGEAFDAFGLRHATLLPHMKPAPLTPKLAEVCSLYDVWVFQKALK